MQTTSCQEKEVRDPPGLNGLGAQSPKSHKNPNPTQKLQQILSVDGLKMEAEARVTHVHGTTYQFQRTPLEVQKSNPNPKVQFNARENSYVEGDPNLGYNVEDTKPRYAPSTQVVDSKSGKLPISASYPSTSSNPASQPKGRDRPIQPTQNWASLFRSQGP